MEVIRKILIGVFRILIVYKFSSVIVSELWTGENIYRLEKEADWLEYMQSDRLFQETVLTK